MSQQADQTPLFAIEDLHVAVAGKEIVKGVSLSVRAGEKHALMGPNGSGKSTLAYALMGHPLYEITRGRVFLDGREITTTAPDERSRLGLFLAFQYPQAIPGVTVANFLRAAVQARLPEGESPKGFRKMVSEKLKMLDIDPGFLSRYVNDGFSGGEKKRVEILQMAVLEPRMAILDETDSGLDIDAVRIVSEGINKVSEQTGMASLLITHYTRILNYVKPDFVHILVRGQLVRSGGPELAHELEEKGYEEYLGAAEPAASA
ncbi:MAG: Fe-S cluster assembly ATPase SufC [Candidatus Sumerlaeia bacterium]